MKRLALEKLSRWKESFRRKPLLLLGARQVGKTWLMKEFGRLCFEHVAYVRFVSDRRVHDIFAGDFNMQRILNALQLLVGSPIVAGKTLLLLDEIQECPAALLLEKKPSFRGVQRGPHRAICSATALGGIRCSALLLGE